MATQIPTGVVYAPMWTGGFPNRVSTFTEALRVGGAARFPNSQTLGNLLLLLEADPPSPSNSSSPTEFFRVAGNF